MATAKKVIEPVNLKLKVVTVKNSYKVQKKQWDHWSEHAKRVFNSVFQQMIDNQEFFKHPNVGQAIPEHWKTTAWNAAWTAADAVDSYKG